MAKHRAKVRAERGIHLNGHHRPRHSEQRFRQNPAARPYLHDRLARLEFRKANDLADDVRIDEEVLSERFSGGGERLSWRPRGELPVHIQFSFHGRRTANCAASRIASTRLPSSAIPLPAMS